MSAERCRHDLPVDQCGECRRPPVGLTARVVITRGGQVFHSTAACTALKDGQRYAERKGAEIHEPVVVALSEAQANNRAACTECFPDYRPDLDRIEQRRTIEHAGRRFPDASAEDSSGAVPADPIEQLTSALEAARDAVASALAAGADRARLTDVVARTLIDIRARVWPNAAPPRTVTPERGRAR